MLSSLRTTLTDGEMRRTWSHHGVGTLTWRFFNILRFILVNSCWTFFDLKMTKFAQELATCWARSAPEGIESCESCELHRCWGDVATSKKWYQCSKKWHQCRLWPKHDKCRAKPIQNVFSLLLQDTLCLSIPELQAPEGVSPVSP